MTTSVDIVRWWEHGHFFPPSLPFLHFLPFSSSHPIFLSGLPFPSPTFSFPLSHHAFFPIWSSRSFMPLFPPFHRLFSHLAFQPLFPFPPSCPAVSSHLNLPYFPPHPSHLRFPPSHLAFTSSLPFPSSLSTVPSYLLLPSRFFSHLPLSFSFPPAFPSVPLHHAHDQMTDHHSKLKL